jgi:hypothetical protein
MLTHRRATLALALLLLATVPARAVFTPPTDLTPFLPANNPASVTKVTTVGLYTIYSWTGGGLSGTIAAPTSYTVGQATVLAQTNESWTRFQAATLSQPSQADITAAQNFFNANINQPFYAPLFKAAGAAIKQAPARRR